MAGQPRLRDVAERAGVSTALVSSYLNTPHLVGEKSRAKIEQAILDLRFVPNDAARQLRRGVSHMVAFVAFDIGDPLFVTVARGAQRRAAEAGLSLVLADTDGRTKTERRYLQLFEEQRVRGILLSPAGDPRDYLNALASHSIPTVLIDQAAPSGRWPAVTVNDVLGGELAVGHLLSIGRRRIAVVGGPARISQVADRISGAQKAVGQSVGASFEVIPTTERTVPAGRVVGQVLAKRSAQRRPDGVFCINDSLATGLIEAVRGEGLEVPRDLAVIGYNDTVGTSAAVPLSSIRQPHEAFGSVAIELLLEELEATAETGRRQVVFDPEVVVRASTAS
jgi:LacI family transcriptional regulator